MIEISSDHTGVTFSVRVQPKASSARIAGEYAGSLKLAVTAAPEAGKANEAVVKLLAGALGVPNSSVRIVSGHASRRKIVHIGGIGVEEIRKLVHRLIS